MKPDELRSLLDRLECSQREFARLTGYTDRTVRHWLAGGLAIPRLVAVVARLLDAGRIKLRDLEPG